MSSIIKVNTYQDANGNALFSSDGSGNVTLSAGAMQNTPAFEAYLSADQSVADVTYTKVAVDTEVYDTDGCYDNSTNYRFTPTVAGKYFVYGSAMGNPQAATQLEGCDVVIYKNGSSYKEERINFSDNDARLANVSVTAVVDMNGSSDYLELFCRVNDTSGTPLIDSDSGTKATYFGAYRLIGA
jgi:hypothetical protein